MADYQLGSPADPQAEVSPAFDAPLVAVGGN